VRHCGSLLLLLLIPSPRAADASCSKRKQLNGGRIRNTRPCTYQTDHQSAMCCVQSSGTRERSARAIFGRKCSDWMAAAMAGLNPATSPQLHVQRQFEADATPKLHCTISTRHQVTLHMLQLLMQNTWRRTHLLLQSPAEKP